jgi:hypothetical protein
MKAVVYFLCLCLYSAQIFEHRNVILLTGEFLGLFMCIIQHCFICRPSDSTVSEDAGIESRDGILGHQFNKRLESFAPCYS